MQARVWLLLIASLASQLCAAYTWHLPRGFPTPAVPADNPMSDAKVALGQRLFFEPRLSVNGRYSCASCHEPARSFSDGRSVAVGATGQALPHNAMALVNVAYNVSFGWTQRHVRSLEAQMLQPMLNQHPVELGLAGRQRSLCAQLAADPGYAADFAAAFPDEAHSASGTRGPVTFDHVVKAIAAFERTLISGRSPFDRYVFGDDRSALSESAKRGMALFYSARGGCAQCHSGLNFSGPLSYEGHTAERASFANTGLYDVDGRGGYPAKDRGLIEFTHRAADMGKFRVPTLRNVALTAPYMHDGSVASLDEVIDHYSRGGHRRPHQDSRVRPLQLSPAERTDLIAFLQSLTDREFIDDPRFR